MKADIIAGKTAKPRKKDGRGGIATGGPGAAARTLGMTATILEYAKRLKLIKDNPARGVKKPPDRKAAEVPRRSKEITTLGQTMREAEAAGENDTAPASTRHRRRVWTHGGPWLSAHGLTAVHDAFASSDTKSGAQLRPIGAEAVKLIEAQQVPDGCLASFPRRKVTATLSAYRKY